MKRKTVIIIGLVLTVALWGLIAYDYFKNENFKKSETPKLINYEIIKQQVIINFQLPKHLKNKKSKCASQYNSEPDENTKWSNSKDNKCTFTIENKKQHFFLKYGKNKIYKFDIEDISKTEELTTNKNILYLALNSQEDITINHSFIGNLQPIISYKIEDENIATIEKNIVTALNYGTTNLILTTRDNIKTNIEIIVTNLIVAMPNKFDLSKIHLPCNQYSLGEAQLLDTILKERITTAEYKTRAGVVAAIRFMTLEFPFRINYFLENGRIASDYKVDGEGRYYHEGLYLHTDKFNTITHPRYGPKIWGCPLESNDYGYFAGNGLDCSGYVSWALLNGGFDVGDLGSGLADHLDLTDYGELNYLSYELLNQNKIKAGDIMGYDGHIAIVAGVTDTTYYVSEALWYGDYFGVVIREYDKDFLIEKFDYTVLMDKYYKEDGNFSNMWNEQ